MDLFSIVQQLDMDEDDQLWSREHQCLCTNYLPKKEKRNTNLSNYEAGI